MYQCYLCGEGFKQVEDLERHAGIVHGQDLELRDDKVFAREIERAYNNGEIGPRVPVPKLSVFEQILHQGNGPPAFLR